MVHELRPWAALGEALAEGGGDAGNEGAEGWGSDWRLRLGGYGGGGVGIGLMTGDREFRCGGHGGACNSDCRA
ncbi:hypothetical protein Lal_00048251 [Lupinus albus]|nr:hypothetical protein Lal_00048251 [Lupinus albus]